MRFFISLLSSTHPGDVLALSTDLALMSTGKDPIGSFPVYSIDDDAHSTYSIQYTVSPSFHMAHADNEVITEQRQGMEKASSIFILFAISIDSFHTDLVVLSRVVLEYLARDLCKMLIALLIFPNAIIVLMILENHILNAIDS